MKNPVHAVAGCHLIGEYVDEASLPADLAFGHGEAVRPRIVASYLDFWSGDDESKDFTVLLRDGRVLAIRGQGLRHFPAAVEGDSGSYGVFARNGGEEVLVALFKTFEIVGIFHGEIRPDRTPA